MKNILLQVKADSVVTETISNTDATTFSIWFWVAIIEFFIIVFLFLKLKKKGNDLKFGDLSKDKMRNAKKSDVDMDNLMNSINGSKDLYKELSRTCHPDRFINADKQKLAEEIFQDISKHKRDFKKLTELKERAITELNINFK
ncbi:hypothetical protein [Patiriisocius sp. Uisw_047]|uniref:hypothetical protein n=1 Tax=Patiriisocius sp. Uisw_047 TaxID=3230969 RepID=UPI0039E7EFE6